MSETTPDPINSVVPGQQMDDEAKAAMAKANAAETEQAHKLAAEARGREGHEAPVTHTVADSIRTKLQHLPPEEGQSPLPEQTAS